jgi:hypothetical protein
MEVRPGEFQAEHLRTTKGKEEWSYFGQCDEFHAWPYVFSSARKAWAFIDRHKQEVTESEKRQRREAEIMKDFPREAHRKDSWIDRLLNTGEHWHFGWPE